jgi:hypothetical protein
MQREPAKAGASRRAAQLRKGPKRARLTRMAGATSPLRRADDLASHRAKQSAPLPSRRHAVAVSGDGADGVQQPVHSHQGHERSAGLRRGRHPHRAGAGRRRARQAPAQLHLRPRSRSALARIPSSTPSPRPDPSHPTARPSLRRPALKTPQESFQAGYAAFEPSLPQYSTSALPGGYVPQVAGPTGAGELPEAGQSVDRFADQVAVAGKVGACRGALAAFGAGGWAGAAGPRRGRRVLRPLPKAVGRFMDQVAGTAVSGL